MKKSILVLPLLAVACSGIVEKHPDTAKITQLKDEPIGCQFLYRLEVDALVYNQDDAIAYLENRIVDQARRGNAYWVVSIRTNPKEWKFFGQERSYVISSNVYRCPPNAITRSDMEKTSDYYLYDWAR